MVPARVNAREPVPISLNVWNPTARPIDLCLRGRTTTFDVVICAADGATVWRRLEGQIIPAIVHVRQLVPAKKLRLATVWDQRARDGKPVGGGEYRARGFLLLEGEPLETEEVAFSIFDDGDVR